VVGSDTFSAQCALVTSLMRALSHRDCSGVSHTRLEGKTSYPMQENKRWCYLCLDKVGTSECMVQQTCHRRH
jgi:hypothetical protein